jgi:hypothetical protein
MNVPNRFDHRTLLPKAFLLGLVLCTASFGMLEESIGGREGKGSFRNKRYRQAPKHHV